MPGIMYRHLKEHRMDLIKYCSHSNKVEVETYTPIEGSEAHSCC